MNEAATDQGPSSQGNGTAHLDDIVRQIASEIRSLRGLCSLLKSDSVEEVSATAKSNAEAGTVDRIQNLPMLMGDDSCIRNHLRHLRMKHQAKEPGPSDESDNWLCERLVNINKRCRERLEYSRKKLSQEFSSAKRASNARQLMCPLCGQYNAGSWHNKREWE